MRSLAMVFLAGWVAIAGHAATAESPVVVELFTSQGCSSCPPADAILDQLGQRDDVIPLALHVDYWDYIGWKDKFAQQRFTKRQKGYAYAAGHRSIYTPQMVINGREEVVGNRAMEVVEMIRANAEQGLPVELSLARRGDTLTISADRDPSIEPADVFVIRYTPRAKVNIPRGENAGLSITYTHIVNDWRRVGDWDGRRPLLRKVNVEGDDPIVVLVQAKGYGPILAAARLR